MNQRTALDLMCTGLASLNDAGFSAPRLRQDAVVLSSIGGLELVVTVSTDSADRVDITAAVGYVHDGSGIVPLGIFLDLHYRRNIVGATKRDLYLGQFGDTAGVQGFSNTVVALARSELAPLLYSGGNAWKQVRGAWGGR